MPDLMSSSAPLPAAGADVYEVVCGGQQIGTIVRGADGEVTSCLYHKCQRTQLPGDPDQGRRVVEGLRRELEQLGCQVVAVEIADTVVAVEYPSAADNAAVGMSRNLVRDNAWRFRMQGRYL